MESKKKKPTVDYSAIIREYEMYGRGRSLKKFCDDSGYVYPNVLRYIIVSAFGTVKPRCLQLQARTALLFHLKLRTIVRSQRVPFQRNPLVKLPSCQFLPCLQMRIQHIALFRCTYPLATAWSCLSARQM